MKFLGFKADVVSLPKGATSSAALNLFFIRFFMPSSLSATLKVATSPAYYRAVPRCFPTNRRCGLPTCLEAVISPRRQSQLSHHFHRCEWYSFHRRWPSYIPKRLSWLVLVPTHLSIYCLTSKVSVPGDTYIIRPEGVIGSQGNSFCQ